MNWYTLIGIVIAVLVVIGAGFAFFSQPAAQPATSPQTVNTYPTTVSTAPSTVSVSAPPSTAISQTPVQSQAVVTALQAQIRPGEPTTLYGNAVVGNYALQLWGNPAGGGEALMEYQATSSQWALVSWGGGEWSVDGLIAEGVPEDAATILLGNMPQ